MVVDEVAAVVAGNDRMSSTLYYSSSYSSSYSSYSPMNLMNLLNCYAFWVASNVYIQPCVFAYHATGPGSIVTRLVEALCLLMLMSRLRLYYLVSFTQLEFFCRGVLLMGARGARGAGGAFLRGVGGVGGCVSILIDLLGCDDIGTRSILSYAG